MKAQELWYIYQSNQQLGPFEPAQVKQLLATKMIAQDAYLFKVGWKDWRPLEECHEELGLPPPAQAPSADRRIVAPRAGVQGKVIVHNDGQLAIGSGANISSSGIFVETTEQLFRLGETLKLTVKIKGLSAPFNAKAKVIRYNTDPRHAVGYGLMFINLNQRVGQEIQGLVDLENARSRERTVRAAE